ncbi:MAG: Lrp/AsnC family transcriptional regulator [Gammaproteobacteria bacterium]|nr:Lrp/AsnC family transcriptional regulator [Gammaproteobacteria bacterium]
MTYKLDQFDRKILTTLQRDAGLTVSELAARIGLSTSPCWRRLKRLEDAGVLKKRVAILDPERLGLDVIVFAEIKLEVHGQEALPNFQQAVAKLPEVLECYTVMGEIDFLLKVVTTDIHAYERFLHRLLSLPMVREINSRMAVSEIKCTNELPLGLLTAGTEKIAPHGNY